MNNTKPGRGPAQYHQRLIAVRIAWVLLLGTVLIGAVTVFTNLEALLSTLRRLPAEVILAVLLLATANYLVRFLRWHSYLHMLGSRISWRIDVLAYVAGFTFTASPGKAGEAGRALLLKPYGIAHARTIGVCVVERLLDLASVLLLATLTAVGWAQFGWVPAVASLLLVLILLMLIYKPVLTFLLGRAQRVFKHRGRLVFDAIQRALRDVRALLHFPPITAGLVVGMVGWSLEATGFWMLANVADGGLSWTSAVGIYAISLLAGAVALLPSGLVGTEIVMVALLMTHGYDGAAAVVVTLTTRVSTLGYSMLLGGLALARCRFSGARALQGRRGERQHVSPPVIPR